MTPQPQGTRLGRYLLTSRLASGGMGEVFVGLQTGLGGFSKPIAVKLLLPHLATDPSSVERFLAEAKLAAQLNHSNVVQILDVGEDDGRYFIAMELVRGVSLSRLIRVAREAGRSLDAATLTHVARGLCDGLHHAHHLGAAEGRRAGLVHRDVTPHNVLVSSAGEVKLADFGIARIRDRGEALPTGTVEGKLEYLAPEQLEGRPADLRSDLYSAGVTLHALATLASPFARATSQATAQAVLEAAVPPLAEVRPDLPRALTDAIARAMARDPRQRFESARAFRDALPPPEGSAPDALGALVRALCAKDVGQLEESATQALRVAHQTASLESAAGAALSSGTASLPDAVAAPPPRSRRPLAAVLAGAAVAALGAAAYLANTAAPPGATPVTPVEEAPPAAALVAQAPPEEAPPAAVAPEPVPAPAAAPDEAPPKAARPTAARAARAAKDGTAYLTVDSEPWSTVSIDGRTVGETPIASFPLPAGTVVVTFVTGSGQRQTRKVRLEAGATKHLRVDFR
ncbi:MAG: protein kinase [Myxococcaceae bacterium]|nr:protein kinase [Myxococcaceae bacterium]